MTQVQIAQRIGVSFATVNRWENAQTKPARLAWRQILDLGSSRDAGFENCCALVRVDGAAATRLHGPAGCGFRGSRGDAFVLRPPQQPDLRD